MFESYQLFDLRHLLRTAILIAGVAASACTRVDYTPYDTTPRKPNAVGQVNVYDHGNQPGCKYKIIGSINAGVMGGMPPPIEEIRQKAADIGGQGVRLKCAEPGTVGYGGCDADVLVCDPAS